MAYNPRSTDVERRALEYLTPDERAFVVMHFEKRSGETRDQHERTDRNWAAQKALMSKAVDAYRRDAAAKANAERARKDAEAKAEADRAEAERYASLTPVQRGVEDHWREMNARWAAEKAATPTPKPDFTKPRSQEMTVESYDPPDAAGLNDADAMEARARSLTARAEAEPSEGNRCQAQIAAADASKARALARFEAERKAADATLADLVARAGDDPIAKARARADAVAKHANRLGEAEAAYQDAELARDKTIVEIAAKAKLAAHRIESRKAAMKADEARDENDPHRLGNPFWKPTVSLADWMFKALDPASQQAAIKQGVRVYDDPAPPFTAADAINVLRSRESVNRQVLTRSEFAALSPTDQAKAARTAVIVGDG